MKNNFKIIFVHGYTASSKGDWYPEIIKKLDEYHLDYSIPDLPGDERPHAADWLNLIHHEALTSTKPLILVGHSLGSRAVLLYLERFQKKVASVFLIAAFDNDIFNSYRADGNYSDFFTHPVDIDKVKKLVSKFYVLHSKDDSSIPYKQGVAIAQDLKAKLIIFNNLDHLYEPKCAPFIFKILKKELKITK